ncbi:hypothetical protein CSC66_09495 [Pseudoxanthomonas kaohsiungensis]|nr:hypothetical protein CSC66_09495 [Pseudoxanthomonas kaohsiungensis]
MPFGAILQALDGLHSRSAEAELARWLMSPDLGGLEALDQVNSEGVRQLGATLEYVRLMKLLPPSPARDQVLAKAQALASDTLARNAGAKELKERWGLQHWAYPPSRIRARLEELLRG